MLTTQILRAKIMLDCFHWPMRLFMGVTMQEGSLSFCIWLVPIFLANREIKKGGNSKSNKPPQRKFTKHETFNKHAVFIEFQTVIKSRWGCSPPSVWGGGYSSSVSGGVLCVFSPVWMLIFSKRSCSTWFGGTPIVFVMPLALPAGSHWVWVFLVISFRKKQMFFPPPKHVFFENNEKQGSIKRSREMKRTSKKSQNKLQTTWLRRKSSCVYHLSFKTARKIQRIRKTSQSFRFFVSHKK